MREHTRSDNSPEGLFACTACGGAEASLAVECPGRQLTEVQQQLIQRGELDYFRGKWWILGDQRRTDFDAVGDFQEKFGLDNCTYGYPRPKLITDDLAKFRIKFMLEELNEYSAAIEDHDLAGAADALVDLVYVALGTAHLHKLPWPELFDEVQRANMTKERCRLDHKYVSGYIEDKCRYVDGSTACNQPRVKHSLRGNRNDVIKPTGWTPPDIEGVLARFMPEKPE